MPTPEGERPFTSSQRARAEKIRLRDENRALRKSGAKSIRATGPISPFLTPLLGEDTSASATTAPELVQVSQDDQTQLGEQPSEGSTINEELKDIDFPVTTARIFVKGLLLQHGSILTSLEEEAQTLQQHAQTENEKQWARLVGDTVVDINTFLTELIQAKKITVRTIDQNDESRWEIVAEPKLKERVTLHPNPAEIPVESKSTEDTIAAYSPFTRALPHHISNQLSPTVGYAQLLSESFKKRKDVVGANLAHKASLEGDAFAAIFTTLRDSGIKITIPENGEPTVSLLDQARP